VAGVAVAAGDRLGVEVWAGVGVLAGAAVVVWAAGAKSTAARRAGVWWAVGTAVAVVTDATATLVLKTVLGSSGGWPAGAAQAQAAANHSPRPHHPHLPARAARQRRARHLLSAPTIQAAIFAPEATKLKHEAQSRGILVPRTAFRSPHRAG
jgi:hypothetical protein